MEFRFRDYQSILPFLRNRRRRFLKLVPDVAADLDRNSKVLDIGSGDGRIAAAVASKCKCQILAIDNSPQAIEATRQWIAEKRVERFVETIQLPWERVGAGPYDRILAVHLLYHLEPKMWLKFKEWALDCLSPRGSLVVVTTSRTAQLHNYFASADVIENMIRRGPSLEAAYGNYVFGEAFDEIATQEARCRSYRTRFSIQWPFGKPSLRHRDISEVEQAWMKLFSFIYRLPVQVLRQEFGQELRNRLENASLDLRIEGRDIVHVLNKS